MPAITQAKLKDVNLRMAIRSIYNCTRFAPKRARVIAKMCKRLDQEFLDTDRQYDLLIEEFAERDEKGNVVQAEGGRPGSFNIIPDKVNDFEEKIEAMNIVNVDISSDIMFGMDDLELVGMLSPAQVEALEPFIQ